MRVIHALGLAGLLTAALASCQGVVASGAGGATSTSTGTTPHATASTTTSAGATSGSSTSGGAACISTCLLDTDCQNTCPPQSGGSLCCDPSTQVCFHTGATTCPISASTSGTSSGTGTGGGPGCTLATSSVDIEGGGSPQTYGAACAPTANLTLEVFSTRWVFDACTQGPSDPLTIQYSNMAEMGAPPPWTSVSAQFDYLKGGMHWTGTGSLTVPSFECTLHIPPVPPPYFFSGTFTATVAPPSADAGAPVTITGSFCVPATCSSLLPG